VGERKGVQPIKIVPFIPKDSRLEQVEEENQTGIGYPRFTWKMSLEMEIVVLAGLEKPRFLKKF